MDNETVSLFTLLCCVVDLFFIPPSQGIGMNLALLELRTTIGDLLRGFHFELADESMRDESE